MNCTLPEVPANREDSGEGVDTGRSLWRRRELFQPA
jgi:hypothetical protein